MKQYIQIAVVGRFTIAHLGHEALFREAANRLKPGGTLTILIGSAGHYSSPKNPLSFVDRAEMLYRIDVPELQEKNIYLEIKPLYDFLYSNESWAIQVQRALASNTCALLGSKKPDGSSDWVDEEFSDLDYIEVPDKTLISATQIREQIYNHGVATNKMNVNNWISKNVMTLVQEYIRQGKFDQATAEYKANQDANLKYAQHPYPECLNSLCADSVVICKNHILMIKRKGVVGHNTWALPGGHKDKGETLQQTALRELDEETKIKVPPMVLRKSITARHVFDSPGRSETVDEKVTQAFKIVLDNEKNLPKVIASDDAKEAKWFKLSDIRLMSQNGKIFADHAEIIHHFTGALL